MAPFYHPVKGNRLVVCFCGHAFRKNKEEKSATCPKCGKRIDE